MITSTPGSSPAKPQFALDGMESPRGAQFKTAQDLEHHLEAWVEATPVRLPLENRKGAAEVIRSCWLDKADRLNLPRFGLSDLPDAVFRMGHLRALNLSDNRFTGLPDELHHLTNLKTLNLSRNPLKSLPEAITTLRDLNGLNLVDTALKSCPRNLFDLPRQCIIYMRGVVLDPAEAAWLHAEAAEHPHGPHIDLIGPPRRDPDRAPNRAAAARRNNPPAPGAQVVGFLNSPPQENPPPAQPAQPRVLLMRPHLPVSAPVPIGQAHHAAAPAEAGSVSPPAVAQTLPAGGNGALEIAQQADNIIDRNLCPELRTWVANAPGEKAQQTRRLAAGAIQNCINGSDDHLVLSNLGLSELPDIMWSLTRLRVLHLGGNELKAGTLPPQIGQLTRLTHLLLGENQLSALPPEIRQLTSLKVLDLSLNFFDALPPELSQLSRLEFLYLRGNTLRAKDTLSYAPRSCDVVI